jgi:hypothetical protein
MTFSRDLKYVMRLLKLFAVACALSASCVFAQVPPAEQLLPDDVVGLVTIPEWTKLTAGYGKSAWGQLWNDPAMKPFRDNFTSNFQADFLTPIERQLGVKLADFQELLRGQVTLALTPPKEGSKQFASALLLVDTRDKSEALTAKLTELRKKWTDAGRDIKTEKIRDVDFSSITFSSADVKGLLQKAFPSAESAEETETTAGDAEKIQLKIGQFKSLLLIGQDEKAIEKVLARQGGGLVTPIAEQAGYQKSHALLFRDSLGHGWLNFKPIYKMILDAAKAEQPEPTPGMPSLSMEKILPAIGLSSLESLAARISNSPEGSGFDFFASVPEAQREGLFRVFTFEKKDAAPPAFVPADVLKFQRTRLDLGKAWTTIEAMLGKIDPSIAGLVQLLLSSAGKEQDPNFDLKKNLFGNLGDDIIQYEKAPKSTKPEDLASAPSLTLIGSPNPTQLLDAMRLLTSLLPPPLSSAPLKEREFLGKKIYSITLAPPALGDDPDAAEGAAAPELPAAALHFAASAGYVAFSSDNALLEDFLRSGETPPKPLRSISGLAESAQKVGGMENGLFTYENQAESLRITMEALKSDPEGFNRAIFFNLSGGEEEGQSLFNRLFNVKLLPNFDRISKYFGVALVGGGSTPEGYMVKAFGPTPAGLTR